MGTLQDALIKKGFASTQPVKAEMPLWKSPLQVLRQGEFELDEKGFKQILKDLDAPERARRNGRPTTWSKLDDERLQLVLAKTCEAERAEPCKTLYRSLNKRTELLADSLETKKDKAILNIQFPGRLRVGGPGGFRERLLPAFHPVYGIPYVPSSSIKGVLLSWAKAYLPDNEKLRIEPLLGYLKGDEASLGKVQILDAFPTAPCLSVDVATPQWTWGNDDRVQYGPSPHLMLSMKKVTLKVGITRTSLGTADDVKTVLSWLQDALIVKGLGSRISAGYGRVESSQPLTYPLKAADRPLSEHSFSLWSQGIYGASSNPQENAHELRPTALRGMLRYWFRAVGLGLYSPLDCKKLEGELFGTIESTAQQIRDKVSPPQGSLKISLLLNSQTIKNVVLSDSMRGGSGSTNQSIPLYCDKATAVLEARTQAHLTLIQHLFKLAIHCGGIGRGSRRPIHVNDRRFRGCYWEPAAKQDVLGWSVSHWQQFLVSLKNAFLAVQLGSGPGVSNPDGVKSRYQDVLCSSATILLVPCPKLIHPQDVRWENMGASPDVLGNALHCLYTRKDGSGNFLYKGETKKRINGELRVEGNASVGGKLGIPSYVVIQPNFPETGSYYQTVIVFGSDYDTGRRSFCADLRQNDQARLVEWPG